MVLDVAPGQLSPIRGKPVYDENLRSRMLLFLCRRAGCEAGLKSESSSSYICSSILVMDEYTLEM